MNGKAKSVWYLLGLLPAVWLGLLVAPAASGGLFGIIRQFPAAMQHPFHIIWCEDSGKAVLFFVAAYGLLVGAMLSTRRSYRRGVEHGSAKWGSPERLNRKYCAKPPEPNKVFTQHIRMGLDGRKHRRNLNTVVVGGSGAGKTRCYRHTAPPRSTVSPISVPGLLTPMANGFPFTLPPVRSYTKRNRTHGSRYRTSFFGSKTLP